MLPTSDKLSDQSYERLAGLIQSQIGIRMPPSKRMMVEGRLRKRVRVLGMPGVEAYCRHLFDENGLDAELTHVIDAITTNKTDFFREPEHFKFLRDSALPQLLADRRSSGKPTIKLWSAACSNGAEPYTIAMVMAKTATAVPKYDYAILGTDICTEVLGHAEKAIYSEEMIVGIPPDMQSYVMRPRNPERKEFRIVPELRQLVRYQRLNLMDSAYRIDRDVDAIFCRNVLIYFDKPTQQAVLERLRSHLRPGGYLFLGHSESMAGATIKMKQVAPTVFVRP